MSERKLIRTYYRSVLPDGSIWCESRDPEEVKRMSEGRDCAFDKLDIYETTDGWEEWKI